MTSAKDPGSSFFWIWRTVYSHPKIIVVVVVLNIVSHPRFPPVLWLLLRPYAPVVEPSLCQQQPPHPGELLLSWQSTDNLLFSWVLTYILCFSDKLHQPCSIMRLAIERMTLVDNSVYWSMLVWASMKAKRLCMLLALYATLNKGLQALNKVLLCTKVQKKTTMTSFCLLYCLQTAMGNYFCCRTWLISPTEYSNPQNHVCTHLFRWVLQIIRVLELLSHRFNACTWHAEDYFDMRRQSASQRGNLKFTHSTPLTLGH